MNYAANANRLNPAAMVGALGVPGAFAAILIVGLAFTVVIEPPVPNLDTFEVLPDPITPPDPVDPQQPTSNRSDPIEQTVTTIPRPDSDYTFELDNTDPIGTLPGLDDGLTGFDPLDFQIDPVPPAPRFNPVSASPRGNPGRWITDSDYRGSWINRGYSGVAGFALEIGANGRVNDCRITASTGHAALDAATCRLLTDRAQFNPAKDTSGNSVAGTYRSSVNWKIPE